MPRCVECGVDSAHWEIQFNGNSLTLHLCELCLKRIHGITSIDKRRLAVSRAERQLAYKRLRDNQRITVLVPNNPKSEGTAAYHMFEQYKKPEAATVGGYDSAIRNSAEERRQMRLPPRADQGRAALRWDLERGFIRLD